MLPFCYTLTENSEVVILNAHILFFFGCWVSLNSGKYQPCILATTLFLCCTCIRPAKYVCLLKEPGTVKNYERMNEFLFWIFL